MKESYANDWWSSKLGETYGLQAKHVAALSLVGADAFPLVDLGAGNGVFLKALEEHFPGAEVSGVEQSAAAIAHKACHAPFIHASIVDWQPETGPVRTACLNDVLEHLEDPTALLKRVAGYAERVLISCPNFNFLLARLTVLAGGIPFQNKPARGGHVYWCQYDSLLALFKACGLKVVAERHMYPKNNMALARALGDLRPSLLAHEFVFLLESTRRDEALPL